jgi:hypothetical protein
MFKVDNIDDYTSLQVLVSIDELIQLATIVGGSNVTLIDLMSMDLLIRGEMLE